MGKYVVRLEEEKFIRWSSVVDAPLSFIMTKAEMKAHLMEKDGNDEETADARIERADRIGTSAMDRNEEARVVISGNRAGPNGEELSLEQIVNMYANEESYKAAGGK